MLPNRRKGHALNQSEEDKSLEGKLLGIPKDMHHPWVGAESQKGKNSGEWKTQFDVIEREWYWGRDVFGVSGIVQGAEKIMMNELPWFLP